MSETTQSVLPTHADSLHAELRSLIANSRQRLAGAVNAKLTRLFWAVGKGCAPICWGGADRAKYGDQLNNDMRAQLAQKFGRGLKPKPAPHSAVCSSFSADRDCRDTVTTIELEPREKQHPYEPRQLSELLAQSWATRSDLCTNPQELQYEPTCRL